MFIKYLIDEDIVNYKKTSIFISFPFCDFKCDRECGMQVCQNSSLNNAPNIEIDTSSIIHRYMNNPLTTAIVFGGLEPLDSWNELKLLVKKFRKQTLDDIVIYTGYKEEEISEQVLWLKQFKNIVIKFGRFVPNQSPHYDEVLGVNLASDSQYAKKVS